MVIVAVAGVPIAIVCIKWTEYGLALLIIAMTNVFGIYHTLDVPHISFSFGTVQMTDILFFIMLVLILKDFVDGKMEWKKTSLNKPLLILILVIAPLQFFRGLFIDHESLRLVARGARPLIYYSIFFIILHQIKSRDQLISFLKLLLFISVISGAVGAYQSLFQVNLSGSKIGFDSSGIARHYSSAWSMIRSGFLVSFCALPFLKPKARIVVIGCEIVLFFSILYTFARSLWGTVAVAMVIGTLLLGRDIGRLFRTLAFITVILIIVIACLGGQKVKSFAVPFQARWNTAVPGIASRTDTFVTRIDLLKASWSIMKANSFALGMGFSYDSESLAELPAQLQIKIIAGADNGIGTLLVRSGMVGVLLFVWIFLAFFTRTFLLLRHPNSPLYKGILIGLIVINIQTLLVSFFSDSLFHYDGIVSLVISWALAELISGFAYSESRT